MSVRVRFRGVLVVAVLLVCAAACEPGWANPVAGSGDGSGTVPGTTGVASAEAAFQKPSAVVAIPGGGFYVYDESACAIYKVATTTTLYAGTPGTCGSSGDGGPATAAQIFASEYITEMPVPPMMALGRNGALYLASDGGQVLRRIDATTGIITSITLPVDLSSNVTYLTGLAADTDGSLVFQTCQPSVELKLYRLADDGTATEVFSSGGTCWGGLANAGPGQFVAIGITGEKSEVIRVDVVAGTASDTGVAAGGVTSNLDGTEYAVTPLGNQIVRIDPDNTVTLIAGTGGHDPSTGRQQGIATAMNVTPKGLAITPNGNLLFTSGHVVYDLADPAHAGAPAS